MTKLPLDSQSMPAEDLSMPALLRELTLRKRPSWILSKLMNALEKKRRADGMGWSRAWNKNGLNVYRTHIQDRERDAGYLALLQGLLAPLLKNAPGPYRRFAEELLASPKLMAFTFYHNSESKIGQYEGLTVSLGSKVESDRSKRDRLDLILEDCRADGRVDGMLDRVRLYACPWSEYGKARNYYVVESIFEKGKPDPDLQAFYEESVRCYHKWKSDESRQWSHWSASYIDYFGPRSFIPVGTSFS